MGIYMRELRVKFQGYDTTFFVLFFTMSISHGYLRPRQTGLPDFQSIID